MTDDGVSMKIAICAVLSVIGSTANGQFIQSDLIGSYDSGLLVGMSADGSTLAVLGLTVSGLVTDAHSWGYSGWADQPNMSGNNNVLGLSGDGGRMLVSWMDGASLSIFEGGQRVLVSDTPISRLSGGITRDGARVVIAHDRWYSTGRNSLSIWANGVTTDLGSMDGRYESVRSVLVEQSTDRFVINAELVAQPGSGNRAEYRAVIYDRGEQLEIETLGGHDFIRTTATDMTGDGTTIVGYERYESGDVVGVRSWMLNDAGFREITFDGYSNVQINSISDDGSLMTGRGRDASGDLQVFLASADGQLWTMQEMLSEMDLPEGWQVLHTFISADGLTLGGSYYHTAGDLVPSVFLYRLPSPSSALVLATCGLLAARRRR